VNAPAIETHQLAMSFGKHQGLLPLSFSVPRGAVYALAGHNGAGKTTLLKLLVNILRPTSGNAMVLGQSSTSITGDAFTRIGYVSENQEMPEWMTVRAFMDYLRPFYPTWDEGTLLRDLDLPEDRKIKHLSRGMHMKLALASVIAFRPSLIIMDEPFSGLDPLVREEIVGTLLDTLAIADERDAPTILVSTHDLGEIESFATHAAMLDHGRLLFAEPLEELTNRFREVTVTLKGAGTVPALVSLPSHWIAPETSVGSVRFIHSEAYGDTLQREIFQAIPDTAHIHAEPMSLRAIFIALTRTARAALDRSAA
jgi:ABC-2 type transport system ATP-binding protein